MVEEAKDAGVWLVVGAEGQGAKVVATDGTVTDTPYAEAKAVLGGFAIVDLSSHEEALECAAQIALPCRCAREVRELVPDPTVCSTHTHGVRSDLASVPPNDAAGGRLGRQ